MKTPSYILRCAGLALILGCALPALAQTQGNPPPRDDARPPFDGPPPFGPGDGGPGGPGGMMREEIKLVPQFDKDGDKRLNAAERKAAREFVQKEKAEGRGRRRPGGRPGGPGGRPDENQEPPRPGPKVAPSQVKSFPDTSLYDPGTLRTFFLEFENADWEKELADFHGTDVEIPAKLTVDGRVYADVGVHFRGASSFMMVGEGRKRSLNLSLDFVHEKQRLGGYRTLNLLNSHEDPTFLRPVLYSQIAREYIPAPRANFARVVINGESWGVYVNVEQFNKDFLQEEFGTTKGARWKVPGSPQAKGGLAYTGDEVESYKRNYELKSKDDPKAWADLINLCRVLNQTAPDKLEQALEPLLDIDGALKFLALENALINNDGYWIRSSDYSLYEDVKGRFHVLPHDVNETFMLPGGPGFGGGPGRRGRPGGAANSDDTRGPGPNQSPRVNGVELDPLIAANDASKPLLSKLLAVPSLRTRYLGYVRDIAERWLDWKKLGPVARQHHALIAADVKADTRKLESTDAFMKGVTEDIPAAGNSGGPGGGRPTISLKSFAEKRRAFLLSHPVVKVAKLPAKK